MHWRARIRNLRPDRAGTRAVAALFLLLVAAGSLSAREKEKLSYGEGLIVNIPLPEAEVEQVIADIAQNGIIRGTKEYNKDEYVSGAKAASSSRAFPQWNDPGKVFYKVREHAIDPRNFKDGGDVGTLAVRYVLLPQAEKNTVLRIDAVFEEDFRHTVHPSSGSVESAEYKDIQEHLDAIEVMKKQNIEAEKEGQELRARKQRDTRTYAPSDSEPPAAPQLASAPVKNADSASQIDSERQTSEQSSSSRQTLDDQARLDQSQSPPPSEITPTAPQNLDEQVKGLRRQVERLVKSPGAPLKSAPFHTASTLQSLTSGTEVLILISTPYWYGIETHDGQHGWIMRDQLEQP